VTKRERTRAARVIGRVMRGACDKEGKGSKAMSMVTRMVGKWTAMAMKRAMAMATRVVGEQWQQ
jgi:hypothetical protein